MDFFDALTLIGGLCLFLFGMNLMGSALEKRAGGSLKAILTKLTSNRLIGFAMGLGVTAVIQSSSATTVMVVGFVNSGLMTLHQAVGVIMGANVGTTVTAWILSLTGIDGSGFLLQMLKPASFTPLLALVGIIFYMFSKSDTKKDTGVILLGFATLMFGMETMSAAVSGLRDVPEFQAILLKFSNPVLGVLAGMALTAIIQSSSASVGILQALSATGQITFGSAIPILMGMDIGTCVTALLSSIGANRNARRAAFVHLYFNVIGTVFWLSVFYGLNAVVHFSFINDTVDQLSIAIVNTAFKLGSTALLLPMSGLLERLACLTVPDARETETPNVLDERLLATPSVAIERCRTVAGAMAQDSVTALKSSLMLIAHYDAAAAATIRDQEAEVDRFEDMLGTYLVRLSSHAMSETDSRESAKLLHIIGDFERISDHAVNIVDSVEEMRAKQISFSPRAQEEMRVICGAVDEILTLALDAYLSGDLKKAQLVEPLEQVIDTLKEQLRNRHILRLQKGECTIELGFIWADLLTDLERVGDHCSNIAGCVMEMAHASMDVHQYTSGIRMESPAFHANFEKFSEKYRLIA